MIDYVCGSIVFGFFRRFDRVIFYFDRYSGISENPIYLFHISNINLLNYICIFNQIL